MENLSSIFGDKLTIDGPQLKLDCSLRNQLMKKLNEHSQFQSKAMDENRQMIAALDSLPVLAKDAEQPPSNVNQDALKFLKEINCVKHQLGVFDAKRLSIVGWFKKFELHCQVFEWSDEQRVEGLVHLLENGLERIVCNKAEDVKNLNGEESKYELVKKKIIDLVTDLMTVLESYGSFSSLIDLITVFDENKFTTPERKYWLGLLTSYDDLATIAKNYKNHSELNRLVQIMAIKCD